MKKVLLILSVVFVSFLFIYNLTQIKTEKLKLKEDPITTTEKVDVFNLGKYTDCKIYSRSSMNIPPNPSSTLSDRSELRCYVDDVYKELFIIGDRVGFETAKNSIYRVWYDSEGYKALIVDQNGAGSGEGNGKILLLGNPNYELLACFYFIPEDFMNGYSDSYTTNEPLTGEYFEKIIQKSISIQDPECINFSYVSYIE